MGRAPEELTAANRYDNFQLVTIFELHVSMPAARHDLTIAFNRHALARKRQRLDQPGHRKWRGENTAFAIYNQGKCFHMPGNLQ